MILNKGRAVLPAFVEIHHFCEANKFFYRNVFT